MQQTNIKVCVLKAEKARTQNKPFEISIVVGVATRCSFGPIADLATVDVDFFLDQTAKRNYPKTEDFSGILSAQRTLTDMKLRHATRFLLCSCQ